MLWLSKLGVSEWDAARTVSECKAYVDDLRKDGRLESTLQRGSDGISFGSYGGLGFNQIETVEFKELANYLRDQRWRADIDRFPDEAEKLANLALDDVTEFTRQVAFGREAKATFAEVPVFVSLNANAFADKLVELPPLHLRDVLLAFSLRYDVGALANRLAEERPWADELEKALLERADKLGPFGRDRVHRMVRSSLGKELDGLRKAEEEKAGGTVGETGVTPEK